MNRSERFDSLDIFRGMTIILMIIVNTPGSGAEPYAQLLHADWHGCTLTDFVFPAFLFAVGTSISFSLGKLRLHDAMVKVIKRTVLLFLIGVALTWVASVYISPEWQVSFPSFANTRIMAVLQRIALAYGAASILFLIMKEKQLLILSAILLLMYWLLLMLLGDEGHQLSITGNAVRKLDIMLLGESHMYKERGVAFDPEGLLSTIPSIVTVLSGVFTGRLLQSKGKSPKTLIMLALVGVALVSAGWAWSLFFPFNKKLWTSSYVLFTSGIFMIVIALLSWYYALHKGTLLKQFFLIPGKNALFIYILATLLGITFMFPVHETTWYEAVNRHFFQALFPGALGSLLFAIAFTLLCWMVAWLMHRKKIYVRI